MVELARQAVQVIDGGTGGLDYVANHGAYPLRVGAADTLGNRSGQVFCGNDSRPQGIVDVVVEVGHDIGQPHHLALHGGRPLPRG